MLLGACSDVRLRAHEYTKVRKKVGINNRNNKSLARFVTFDFFSYLCMIVCVYARATKDTLCAGKHISLNE